MELKFDIPSILLADSITCSNRTFMELKYLLIYSLGIRGGVLIVPLWN